MKLIYKLYLIKFRHNQKNINKMLLNLNQNIEKYIERI